MKLSTAAAIWASIVALAAILGMLRGFGGPRFVIALGVAAVLFAFEFFLAAPKVLAGVQGMLRERGGIVAPFVPLFAVLVYSYGVTGNLKTMLVGAAYTVLPALLVASDTGKAPGTWEDYAAVALLWLPIEFQWLYRLFPYPPPLTHTLSVLMAVSVSVAAFVLLRRVEGIAYAVEWRRGFGWNFALHFAIFAAIAIPIGIRMRFLIYDPTFTRLRSLPLTTLGILFFTAWPEEFLFRGLLQNFLTRTFKNEWAGLFVASVIFGLSHIVHAPYPNWKYVLLATIAGLFYGHMWMRTRSLFPGTLVHALVDISWHVLFR
jgi:uncharacterized protein